MHGEGRTEYGHPGDNHNPPTNSTMKVTRIKELINPRTTNAEGLLFLLSLLCCSLHRNQGPQKCRESQILKTKLEIVVVPHREGCIWKNRSDRSFPACCEVQWRVAKLEVAVNFLQGLGCDIVPTSLVTSFVLHSVCSLSLPEKLP